MFNKQPASKRPEKPRIVNPGKILIVCEGERTEPNYFKWWEKQINDLKSIYFKSQGGNHYLDIQVDESPNFVIDGTGKNTVSLVTHAIDEAKKSYGKGIDYTSVWCVFDRDSFEENFGPAVKLCETHNKTEYTFKMFAAYSNEAFELWYLLHFDYIDAAISRKEYQRMLTDRIKKLTSNKKFEYAKNDPNMYNILYKQQGTAIRNAKKLLAQYENREDYHNHNPCTTVYKLVEELNRHLCDFRNKVAPEHKLLLDEICEEKIKKGSGCCICTREKTKEKTNCSGFITPTETFEPAIKGEDDLS